MTANSVTAKADEVDEVTESIVMGEDTHSHSEVIETLTPTQSVVREAVMTTPSVAVEANRTTEEKTLVSDEFDTKEEAQAFIEGKKEENIEDITYEFEEIKERTETIINESDINEVVDSMEEVELYIDDLESQGYNYY